MVFPAVMYGCESWTVKKAESRRIAAFELCVCVCVCVCVHARERVHVRRCAGVYVEGEEYVSS